MKVMERLNCTIERKVYQNTDNGYGVFQVSRKDAIGWNTIVGIFQGVREGMALIADGDWVDDKKYGRQFRVETWREELPVTAKGIELYLASGLIKGIGPKYASMIAKAFGADTFNVLNNAPERLLEVQGISKKRMAKILKSWEEQKSVSDIMVFLQSHGVSTAYAVRIYKRYGKDSIEKVKENPYSLADDVFGIGFLLADRIAESFGFEKNDLRRCKAGVVYTLKQMSNDGHCYADRQTIIKSSMELLAVDGSSVEEALNHLTFEQDTVLEDDSYFLSMYYHCEVGVAKHIKRLMKKKSEKCHSVDIKGITKVTGVEYDDIQADAIRQAVRSKVMVLTGLPGTGKTTTLLGIIEAFGGKTILCAAPTGRAAKRMSEATGREAKTIHRLLEYNPEGGFSRNEGNPLRGDVLIVDESSMIDIMLMYSLLRAMPAKMRLILVGDIDQLPSVGAGNVLRDIIDSGAVPVVRLTRIFRQAMTSRIVTNAHRINRGEFPDISNGKDADFFFIRRDDAVQAARDVVTLVKERIPKAYGYTTDDIQVLVPMKNGACGTTALNIAIQEAVNPVGECIDSGQYKYRVGDKVMQIRNNYDKNVFNGDVGVVRAVDAGERAMTVVFDGNEVLYESSDIGELTLAYATTVHKSQGSEYPVVIMPLLMSHYIMLQRNLVYTGVTRAKKLCIMIGDVKALGQAVRNMSVLKRNTKLKERLME